MFDEDVSIKKFSKNFLKYSPSSFIPAIIGFLTIPFLAKIFNPSDYGNYILVISIVNFLSIIINAVCGDSAVRFFTVYKKENKLKSFYDSLIGVYLIFTITLTILSVLMLYFIKNDIDPSLFNLMLIGIPLFILTTAFFVIGRLIVAKEESGIYSFFISFQSILGFLFSVIFILVFKTGISGIILGYMTSFALFLPFIYHYTFKGKYIGKKFSKEIFLRLIKYGIPVAITNLAAWVLSIFDRYVLGYYWGSAQVGIYSASYTLSETTMTVILNLFMLAGYPAIVKIWEHSGKKPAQEYIGKLTRYYILISIPVAVGLSVLAKPVIEILTSPAYYQGYTIIPIVVFGALLLGLQWWALLGLLLNNKTHVIAIVVIICGFLNIVTNFLLIPKYSFIGAAISTAISYLALLLMMIYFSRPYLNWNFPSVSIIKIFIASIIMGSILYSINSFLEIKLINLSLEIILGILIYILMLYLLKEFEKEELSIINVLIQKKK
jgi:O-antigen/teichoic acid export membrane protein